MNRILTGALSGVAATVPMSVVMWGIDRLLPRERREEPVPPYKITVQAAHKAGVGQEMNEQQKKGSTMAAHFGMGSAAATLYPLVFSKLPGPRPLKGAALGLAVWAGNYLGLMPAAGLYRPATRQSFGRNLDVIVSHLVWGTATAALFGRLRRVAG